MLHIQHKESRDCQFKRKHDQCKRKHLVPQEQVGRSINGRFRKSRKTGKIQLAQTRRQTRLAQLSERIIQSERTWIV